MISSPVKKPSTKRRRSNTVPQESPSIRRTESPIVSTRWSVVLYQSSARLSPRISWGAHLLCFPLDYAVLAWGTGSFGPHGPGRRSSSSRVVSGWTSRAGGIYPTCSRETRRIRRTVLSAPCAAPSVSSFNRWPWGAGALEPHGHLERWSYHPSGVLW